MMGRSLRSSRRPAGSTGGQKNSSLLARGECWLRPSLNPGLDPASPAPSAVVSEARRHRHTNEKKEATNRIIQHGVKSVKREAM